MLRETHPSVHDSNQRKDLFLFLMYFIDIPVPVGEKDSLDIASTS